MQSRSEIFHAKMLSPATILEEAVEKKVKDNEETG